MWKSSLKIINFKSAKTFAFNLITELLKSVQKMSMYRFNNLSGKIVGGAGQRIGQAIKGAVQDSPQIIFESKKVKFPTVIQTVTPTKPGYGEVPAFLLKKYEHFQKDNGIPIHLKGGTTDVVLYYITLLGCAIGLEECFRYYYEAAFPKKE